MDDQIKKKKNGFKTEWIAVIFIFLIAFATGYFYTTGRLQEKIDSSSQQQIEETVS